ncbi:MAG: hypothetical protein ABJQ29_03310 [Luteolibacter sp.]
MTTQEIQQYIDTAIRLNFSDYTTESGEMMTSEEGDGRFLGKVVATMYVGLPGGRNIFLAIGETAKKSQIIKLGDSECLKPSETELDLLLQKELGIEKEKPGAEV